MHTMEYYSVIKKNENNAIAATWMDLEMITPSEVNQRKIHHVSFIYGI